jgi:hypothetical protein
MKAYIEVSVINRSIDQGHDAISLAENLRVLGYEPVLGLNVIYELAKCFLTDRSIPRGRELFAFVDDLAPTFHREPQQLMQQEVERFRHGTVVLPFLDHLNHVSTVMDVRKLRAGILSTYMREIIETREADIAANAPKNDALYLRQVDELRVQYPGKVRRFSTYEDVLIRFAPDAHRFVKAGVNRSRRLISADEARRIANRIDEFPTIRSVVRAHMYLLFHCLVHRTGAARDKLGDYRHVVEAAYCKALATADRRLAKTIPKINPELLVLTFETLWGHKLKPRGDSN